MTLTRILSRLQRRSHRIGYQSRIRPMHTADTNYALRVLKLQDPERIFRGLFSGTSVIFGD